jgi:hypothetical protein
MATEETTLIMADLVNGATVLFGVQTPQSLEDYMAEGDGGRFIQAINMQMLVSVKYVMCPKCETLTATSEQACTGCGLPFGSPEMIQALQAGKARVVPKTKYVLKALADGSENNAMMRPQHIISYDTISERSRVYKDWKEVTRQSQAKLTAFNTGLDILEKDVRIEKPGGGGVIH